MIAQGFFRIFNFFDIAEAFEMQKLRSILGSDAEPYTPGFAHRSPEYAQSQNTPIVEAPTQHTLPGGEQLTARIKYYWFGVASVELIIGFESDFDALCQQSYRWMNAPDAERAAEEILRSRLDRLRPALVKPSTKWLDEDYLVIDIESARNADGQSPTAADLLQNYSPQIAQIVRGELIPLSTSECEEIVRSALSYYPSDLLVVGWAAALVYDKPDSTPAVIDLLEYANTQLLEFRYYDELLTSVLSNVYTALEGHESFLSRWRLPRRAGHLNGIRLDIMDLVERTEYAVKFISDTYYARVYRVCSARIGVNDYEGLVSDKLKTAGELYEFMVDQFNERRMFALEVIVTVLVFLDFIAFLRGK